MIQPIDGPMSHEERLPFPTKPLKIGNDVVEEYIIPDDRKQEVLEQLYIFEGVPSLDEELYDLHEGKKFLVRDFRVTWEDGQNWLVSPYYPNSGGTVIDWMPADWDDENDEMCEGEEVDEDDEDWQEKMDDFDSAWDPDDEGGDDEDDASGIDPPF